VLIDFRALVIIGLVAVLAPLIVELPPRLRLPVVVAEIGFGIVIGPDVLDLVQVDDLIDFLSQLGLAFLFFLAGLEIELPRIRGRPLKLATQGWLLSIAIAFGFTGILHLSGYVVSELYLSVALATTALGILMPILRDLGELETRFGTFTVAAGALGEFGPILAIALLLSGQGPGVAAILLAAFTAAALLVAYVAMHWRPPRLLKALQKTMHSSAQLPVRLSVLILLALVYLASREGLDLLLGAFAAGIIVGLVTRSAEAEPLRVKLEGLGFGFFIPIFFVVTGIEFNLSELLDSPSSILRLPLFVLLFLLVRGLPVFLLYRRDLERAERLPLALLSATALPLVVAVTTIAVEAGKMRPENAAALVGAGMVSVFLYPLIALTLRRRGRGAPSPASTPHTRSASQP
jgi:Kef-type K+ transport system membrane component KefB